LFYKFLHTEDIDRVLREGTLMVRSLKYFRELEDKQKPWIGDRLEGSTELTTPPTLTLTEGSPELEMVNRANIGLGMFKEGFAKVSGGGRIEMGGAKFVHQVPSMYIYSYSCGDLDELKKAMCVDTPEPYSACLKIKDPEGLLNTIMTQGEVLTTKTAVSATFKAAGWAQVAYEDVTQDIRTGPAIAPSPFKKARRFASQCEYRFAFDPAVDAIPESIIIKISDTSKHFHEVFRDFRA
jgi:hypothetical protein